MSNLLKGGGFLFIGRAYNDIDHMTPIAYRLKSDQPKIEKNETWKEEFELD